MPAGEYGSVVGPATNSGADAATKAKGLKDVDSAVDPKTGLYANEVQIEDRAYKLDEQFIRKHPGGSVIKSKLGQNCTQAFHEFHHRSPKARKWLSALPSRPAPHEQDALLKDFDALRADFVKEGMFEFSPAHAAYRFAEIFALNVISYLLLRAGWWWTGLFIMGITSGRCGWLQHEFNHNSITGNLTFDKFWGSFFFGVGEAGSAAWWRNSHNRHHASPQHLGYDTDLQTLPAMAFDAVTARLGNPKWLKFQAWTFVPSTMLVVLVWKLYVHPEAIIRKKQYLDGFWLVVHYLAWYYFFSYQGVLGMVASHLVWGSVAGVYLFTHFALSHTHKEVLLKDEHEDWVRSAVLRTTNVRSENPVLDWCISWVMGYLNYQIEHHLYPNMPQFRHPLCAPRVKALCQKHGLEYDEKGYFEVFYATFKNLDDVGHGLAHGKPSGVGAGNILAVQRAQEKGIDLPSPASKKRSKRAD